MADAPNAAEVADQNDPWLRSFFISRIAQLDADRTSYWETWRDQTRVFAPKRGRYFAVGNDNTRGRRKDQRIIDNTPLTSLRTFASGMMAGATSPARPWFRLRFMDPGMNEVDGVKAWLDECQRRMLDVFRRSNLYDCLNTLYAELGTFATGALLIDDDDETVVRGYVLTAGEYWLASSRRLQIDTLYRSFFWTGRQVVDKFGRDDVSGAISSLYDAGRLDQEYEIVHAIEPNPNALPEDARIPKDSAFPWDGRLSKELPWRSVWFERAATGPHQLLRVSGYHEFPAVCPRWETTGTDTYGSGSPGWMALGDAQQLQVQQRDKMGVMSRLAKPPMVAHPSMNNRPMSMLPAGVTFDASPEGKGFRAAYEVKPEGINAIREDITEVQQRVKDAWYVPLFLAMLENDREQPDTAREVDEKHEEKMLMLGPMLERLHSEGLSPLVNRVYKVMARMGLIPPPPQGVNLASMEVEFVSILAQAQKAANLTSIERLYQFVGSTAEITPEMKDRLDADGTYDSYSEMLGTPAVISRDKDAADAIRQARAKQAQQQQSAEQIAALAQAGTAASKIDVGGGQNAVQAVLGRQP